MQKTDGIRRATREDAAQIAHVHVDSWRTTYRGIVPEDYLAELDEEARAAMWRDGIASDAVVFVAERDEELVGFICGGAIREPIGEFDAELYAVYLLERAQRSGIGRALLKRLAEELTGNGFKSMAVWVLEDNKSSGFYEGSGAVRVAGKEIEIGGARLQVVAYGWARLDELSSPR